MKLSHIRRVFVRTDRGSATLTFPTKQDVESLKVGDLAPSCFGSMQTVNDIFARGVDIEGRAYVCYNTISPKGFKCSSSMKEDTLERSVHASNVGTSAQLDDAERNARGGYGILPD